MWFAQLESYGENIYTPLAWATLIMLLFYFVTSSDSGSHVVDCHASNGVLESPPIQKIYWSVTEGATAIVLMMANAEEGVSNGTALRALQAVSIIAGVPVTVLICFYCVSLYKYCDAIYSMEHPTEAQATFISEKRELGEEPMDYFLGIKDVNSVWNVVTRVDGTYCTGFWISVVCPVVPLYKA
jgi:choline-glycine betaine transporter